MPYLIKKYDSSLTETASLEYTDGDTAQDDAELRVAVNGSGEATVIAYTEDLNSAEPYPSALVWQVSSGFVGDWLARGTLSCWVEASLPFYAEGRCYVAMSKLVMNQSGADFERSEIANTTCLLDITPEVLEENNLVRPVAVLDFYTDIIDHTEPTFGYVQRGVPHKPDIYESDYKYEVAIGGSYQSTFGSTGFEFRLLSLHNSKHQAYADGIISGGLTSSYDGVCASEVGFVEVPSLILTAQGSGGAIGAGTYNFVGVYEFKDFNGKSHFSATSAVGSIVITNEDSFRVYVPRPVVTAHQTYMDGIAGVVGTAVILHLYRTEAGGTQYFKIATRNVFAGSSSGGNVDIQSAVVDADLISLPLFFRQPGTAGSALDRRHALASGCVVKHKDRIFYGRGSNIYYSSFSVDGESDWFSPALFIPVPNGSGPIIGLSSMDGILVVFKQNAIYVIDGDGPPENGGSGLEFSPPRQILTEFGCIDQRTIVPTPNGIMYRSSQGIMMLTRNLQVVFIGERVFRTVDAHPYSGGACFDPSTGRAIFLMGQTRGFAEGLLESDGEDGVAVVYSVQSDTWTKYKITTNAGYGGPVQDVVVSTVPTIYSSEKSHRTYWGDATGLCAGQGTTYSYDKHYTGAYVSDFVPMVIETGFIRSPSKQDRIRLTDFHLIGTRNAAFTITTKYATDYSSSYTTVKSWANSVTDSLTVVQLETQPPKELVQSMSFRIETSEPSGSFGSGKQLDIFGLTVRVGLKGGGAKVAAAQKG